MSEPQRKRVTFEDIERRLVGEHKKPYFDWLRHVVTLSVAALTALVALQGHYVPEHPRAPILLAVAWAALAITIVSGLVALRAEYLTPLQAVDRIRRIRKIYGDEHAAVSIMTNEGTPPSKYHRVAVRTMVGGFIVALLAICLFASVNLPW